MRFTVNGVAGLGGSCIVYDGYYLNNAGARKTVRIRECCPYKLHIKRSETGALCVSEREREAFEEYKSRLRDAFEIANELHEAAGLTNITANLFDCYEANGTVYMVSSYVEGNTLESVRFHTLKDAVRAVAAAAKGIGRLHRKGYLYLDVKPENILVYEETPDLVWLFDFDSVIPMGTGERMTEFKISCSPGFAPQEQRQGDLSRIGTYTDVYSIGALLFYLLFGRAPRATDCGFYSVYDYSGFKWDALYRNRLYEELTVFFRSTLQVYAKDRYQDMDDAVVQLEKIARAADMEQPFVYSSFVPNSGAVIGREAECGRLLCWYHSGEKLLFVSGMGGIGKSTVVRKFAEDYREEFDEIVSMQYKGCVCNTLADDVQFRINGCEKTPEESTREYFARKMKMAAALVRDTNTLVIIDNFDGVLDEDFTELLRVDWRLIVVTRAHMGHAGYAHLRIGELCDRDELRQLFESNLGRRLGAGEYQKLERIMELSGHTLILVLIAKQISKSYLTVEEAAELIKEHGFSGIAAEKIDFVQDGAVFYDKAAAIIRALFDVSVLSEDKKKCLKILSLFDAPGIDIRAAQALLKLASLDEINELEALGWLEIADRAVWMHPLIRETIDQVPWSDECRALAVEEMQVLSGELRRDRGRMGEAENIAKYKRLQRNLYVSKSILLRCGRDASLRAADGYRELMLATLLQLSRDEEKYILFHAQEIFRERACKNPRKLMELYGYVVYLLCQKKAYDAVQSYLSDAGSFAEQSKDDYIRGLYYGMLGNFYDELLEGAYHTEDKDRRFLRKQMLRAADQSIFYMRKAGHGNAKYLYTTYMLGKAALLIRSAPGKHRKIKALLSKINGAIEKHQLGHTGACAVYYMTWGWYYTLCEPDERAALHFLKKAADVNAHREISKLDQIDDFYIPAANMMCELADIEKAYAWLEEAILLCDAHADILPYIRKKQDLLAYKLEVCYYEGDMEEYERVRGRMERLRREAGN